MSEFRRRSGARHVSGHSVAEGAPIIIKDACS